MCPQHLLTQQSPARNPSLLAAHTLAEMMARSRRAFTSQTSRCALCPLQQIWQCWDAPERSIPLASSSSSLQEALSHDLEVFQALCSLKDLMHSFSF